MNRSPENDLHSLLPTLAGPLPPELVDLATSLLAQSRNRISNLKPQEEPARSYVCAHIACDRLKHTLDLPPIDPRPPLAKRPYESLLAYFRKALPAGAKKVSGSTSSTTQPSSANEISRLCNELGLPNAEAHIHDGVAAVLSTPENSMVKGDTAMAVIAAVTFITIERLTSEDVPRKVGSILWGRCTEDSEKLDEIMAVLANPTVKASAVNKWVQELSKQGSRKWQWIKKIEPGGGIEIYPQKKEASKRKRIAVSGIGSMLQERVDFLSYKRRRAHAEWREKILKQVEDIEAGRE